MRGGLLKVTFRFPGFATEVRFLERLPEAGKSLEALNGRTWRVARVRRERKGLGYEVVCEPVSPLRNLAEDLLRRVRRQSVGRGRR